MFQSQSWTNNILLLGFLSKGFVHFFFVLFSHSYHFLTTIHILRLFLGVNFFYFFFCLCFNINCLSFVTSFRAFCSKGSQSKLSSIPFRYQLRLFSCTTSSRSLLHLLVFSYSILVYCFHLYSLWLVTCTINFVLF